jgi:LacI family transcriptional regulator
MTKRATLAQVARRAGVSQPVVSKVLNGAKSSGCRTSPATRQRIERAAADLGYRRDLAAAATRSGRFGNITLVPSLLFQQRPHLPAELLTGVAGALEAEDYTLSLAHLSEEALENPEKLPRMLRHLGSDGLLINYHRSAPPALQQLVDDTGVPAVWLNEKRERDTVYADDFNAGAEATRRLLDAGHQRVVYVSHKLTDPVTHYSEQDRGDGYQEVMRQAGLEPEALTTLDADQRMAWLNRRLAAADRPTGFVCYGGKQVEELLHAAARRGLACPEHVSVVSFGEGFVQVAGQKIDTYKIPANDVGRAGVQQLLQRVRDGGHRPSTSIPFFLDPGQSVGPVRAS